ncbi:Ras-GEF domain-containing family member 1B [Geodia barretti]|nr:Ras-GEF domain-containing family member 1B [Geodia barretti]
MQYERLYQEMKDIAVAGLIQKRPKMKASRSLPAIGLGAKHTPRPRPSLFGHFVPPPETRSPDSTPQTSTSLLLSPPPPSSSSSVDPNSEEVVYKDGVVVAGSLDGLISLLLPSQTHQIEQSYVFAFVLCSRLFIQPHQLLGRVTKIFSSLQKQQPSSSTDSGPANKIVELLSEWAEMFPYDFRDERMMRSLKDVTQHCASLSPELRRLVGQLQAALVKKLSVLDKYEHILAQVNAVSMERLINPKTQVNILSVCDSPQELAQQLTHIELERLNNIGPEEFIQTFVRCPEETEPLYRDMKKTSNIEAYVEWFNRLSYLVATEICVSDKKRNRAKLLEFFLDTAAECRKLNNFNSFMAISAGLFMSPVTRLKRTRSKVSSSKLHTIEAFVDPFSNFSTYRHALVSAFAQASKSREKMCVVPFFSLLVKDLYFLNEGMSNRLPSGHIRFEKCMALARLVSQILAYKETVLPFSRVRGVLNYLMTIPIHTDDELQLASFEIEPPENAGEKKRFQELRMLLGSFGQRIGRSSSVYSPTFPPGSLPFSPIQEET